MTLFDKIVERILKLEGGFVNDPKDPGGKTKYGISQKSFGNLKIEKLTKEQAKAIYKKYYWAPHPFYQMCRKTPAFRHGDIRRSPFVEICNCIRWKFTV